MLLKNLSLLSLILLTACGFTPMNKISDSDKTYALTEQIEIRNILPLTICFDHRALDFSEVSPFIWKLEEIFNNPEIILGE